MKLTSTEALHLDTMLSKHIEHCEAQFDVLTELRKCIEATTDAVNKLASDMEPIIELKDDLKGAANLGIRIQKLGLSIVKWPIIGAGLYAIYKWVVDLIPQ